MRCRTIPWSCAARMPLPSWRAGTPPGPEMFTSTVRTLPPIRALSSRTSTSRDANPVPRRFTAPRFSHVSNVTVASDGWSRRSASSSNFTMVRAIAPSATQRQTRSSSGTKPVLAKRPLETGGVYRPRCNLKVDLYIDVRRSCVPEPTPGAEQFRDQPSEHDELRPSAVMTHDAHERSLRRLPRGPGAERRVIDHGTPPGDARRLPHRARRRRAGRRIRGAMAQRAGRPSLRQVTGP